MGTGCGRGSGFRRSKGIAGRRAPAGARFAGRATREPDGGRHTRTVLPHASAAHVRPLALLVMAALLAAALSQPPVFAQNRDAGGPTASI